MDRRAFLGLAGGLLAAPLAAEGQQAPKVAKIGVLTPSSPAGSGHLVEAFTQGLRDLGYIEGKTFVLEVRYGDGRSERLAELARGLVRLKPEVIVTSTDLATAAVRRQTRNRFRTLKDLVHVQGRAAEPGTDRHQGSDERDESPP